MIIRATSKLLKISGIKPVKYEEENENIFPGEWYANTVKTGHIGKLVVLFFHNKTKISIICPTKSLNIAIKQLPERLEEFLKRNKFESIIKGFELFSEIRIYSTKDRSTLAFMNQISANIEYHLIESNSLENFDYRYLEDIHTEYLFSINGKAGKYETTIDILKRLIS